MLASPVNRFNMENQPTLHEVMARKAEAENLLRALMEAKKQSEAILAEGSRRDLFKRVTGQSSLENAIAETSRAISAYDRVLSDQNDVSSSIFCVSTRGVPSVL